MSSEYSLNVVMIPNMFGLLRSAFHIWYKPWNRRSYFKVSGHILSTESVINELMNRWGYPDTWRLHPSMAINFSEQILPMLEHGKSVKGMDIRPLPLAGQIWQITVSCRNIKKILYYFLLDRVSETKQSVTEA